MKQTVNLYNFRQAFLDIRPDNFSYTGLETLYDYLTELEDDIGEEMELDVIAICCDYSEESATDIANNYDIDLSECEDNVDRFEAVKDYLENEGFFVGETYTDDDGEVHIIYRNH